MSEAAASARRLASTACCTSRRTRWSPSPSREPELYWDNNVGGTLALLAAMRAAGVPRLVFSSTAATYGEPTELADHRGRPAAVRPTRTAQSKLAVDHMHRRRGAARTASARSSLRYFNVAGALRAAAASATTPRRT